MSIRLMNQVWNDSKAEGSALLLLLSIADYCNDDGKGAWPSVKLLAKRSRQTDRNIQKLLRTLEELGELKIHMAKGAHGTNLYEVIIAGGEKFSGVNGGTPGGERWDTGGVNGGTPDPPVDPPVIHHKKGTARPRFVKPTQEEAMAYGAKIGLPFSEAEAFMDHFQCNGWLVGKSKAPMKDWEAAMRNWKRMSRPSGASRARPLSVLDLKTIMTAKAELAARINLRYCSEVAAGVSWNDQKQREAYFALKKEIAAINAQIGGMA